MTARSDIEDRRRRRADEMKGGLERRTAAQSDIELREAPGGGVKLVGYASVTEHGYEVGDFMETVARGAFKRTLGEQPDLVLLANHEGLPLARTRSSRGGPGTLRLQEDDHGLLIEADLDPEDRDADAVIRKLRRGDLDGQMSMAFRVTDQQWSEDYTRRRIKSLTLSGGDVSLVNMAANPAALAALRAQQESQATYVPNYVPEARMRLLDLGATSSSSRPAYTQDPIVVARRRLDQLRRDRKGARR